MPQDDLQNNPLYNQGDLPNFEKIAAEHVVPAVREAIRLGKEELAAMEKHSASTWQGFVLPLRQITRRLDRIWGVVNHLLGVKNSDALRAAHETVQPEVVEFQLSLGQSRVLFDGWQALWKNRAVALSTPARERIAAAALRDARLAGVALEGATQERFNELQRELASLTTKFSNAVLDATAAFTLAMENRSDVEGMPESWLSMAAAAAKAKGHAQATAANGPWLLTLDFPSYYPFLQHAKNRALREKVYRAQAAKAGGVGYSEAWNNWPLIDQILTLRREEAHILGYANFAEISLASKMAPDAQKIRAMIEDLAQVARPQAHNEIQTLAAFAKEHGHDADLQLWDIPFYSERRREALYAFNDEQLRPYFPLAKVLEGLFQLAQTLFNVAIRRNQSNVSVWHSDVQFFDVENSAGETIAHFYLDPYARSGEKRAGAWMDVCRQRETEPGEGASAAASIVLPVAYLVCNGTPPVTGVDARPSLMTFNEVETLFHEFGHGLQHMLTRVDEYEASGIANVEWDAVELPSQFMENWVYERSVIDQISGHYKTGEVLPQALFEKIIAAKNYMAASQMLRQLYFSLLDLELHEKFDATANESVRDIQRRIAADYAVLPPLADDAFLCSFGHIFAGGYAAGYYSYKWAEVLSADAFAAFEEAGLTDTRALQTLGLKYRDTILALGGSQHPLEIYRKFRGRDATTEALLRHNGLTAA